MSKPNGEINTRPTLGELAAKQSAERREVQARKAAKRKAAMAEQYRRRKNARERAKYKREHRLDRLALGILGR